MKVNALPVLAGSGSRVGLEATYTSFSWTTGSIHVVFYVDNDDSDT